ncbi:MAG TPA: PAS domain S-box protein [Bacteroidales bacterium]|nr:PAS domain S-box protein [Bacteroidales bacterium]
MKGKKEKGITELSVLILEDSVRDLELICELLSDSGYLLDLTHVADEAGFDKALREKQFSIILSDFNLPGFDAFGALRISNQLCPDVPFICISGSIGEETAIELLKLGAVDYVLKDRPDRLPFAVHRALEETNARLAHRKAARELEESELRFKQVAETTMEWIWEVNADGLYTYASPVITSLLGYSASEVVGKKHFYDFFIPEHRDELMKAAFEVFSRKEVFRNFDNANIHKDGHLVILKTSGSPILDENGNLKGYRGADADVTEQKKAENDLRESEEKFRNLFRDHSAIKIIIDPWNGNIIEANNAAVDFYGWSSSELKNISQINTLPFHLLKAEMEKARTLKRNHFVFKHKKADGSLVDVEVFSSGIKIGNKQYLHSIIHDITEKRKAEEKIRLLNRAVESSSVSIIVTESTGRIIYTNPFFSELTGYSAEDVSGKNPRILNSGYQPKSFYENLWQTILSGSDWEGEFRNRKKNGDLYWEKAIISPIADDTGRVTNFVAIKEDITERKRTHEELIRAKDKAEESDRLKTAFLNNISHEIRTPMNAIIGYSALLSESDLDESSKNLYIDTITQSSNKLLAIISDIIDISNIEAGVAQLSTDKFSINEKLDTLRKLFNSRAETMGIAFNVKMTHPDNEAVMIGDEKKMFQILFSIVENAFKFTQKGHIDIGYKLAGDFIEFSVSDTGIGIHQDQLARIFDRFYQVDHSLARTYEGTGLGLSISKAYTELMGGKIWVESKPGKGSVFYLSLPVISSGYKGTGNVLPENVKSDRLFKVLLVEDDELNARVMSSYLKLPEIMLKWVRSGEEAVKYCFTEEKVDLVIMDLRLPGISGIEAVRKIKEKYPELCIVAQTAYALSDEFAEATSAGCSDFITKPFSKEFFVSRIMDQLKPGRNIEIS